MLPAARPGPAPLLRGGPSPPAPRRAPRGRRGDRAAAPGAAGRHCLTRSPPAQMTAGGGAWHGSSRHQLLPPASAEARRRDRSVGVPPGLPARAPAASPRPADEGALGALCGTARVSSWARWSQVRGRRVWRGCESCAPL